MKQRFWRPLAILLTGALIFLGACDRDPPTGLNDTAHAPTPVQINGDIVTGGACDYSGTIPSTGVLNLGVVRVDFADLSLPGYVNNSYLESLMFTGTSNVADCFREMSYDQLDFTYDIFTPITLGLNWDSNCLGNSSTWACAAIDSLDARGVTVDDYDMFVLAMPNNGCTGSVGGVWAGSARSAVILSAGTPSVYAHEMGHGLGMNHASRNGGEYNDGSDIMGKYNMGLRHVNGPHKELMGWLSGGDILIEDDAVTDEEITIGPLTLEPTQPVLVKIPKRNSGGSDFYYLSYRIDSGYDASLASADPDDGVYYVDKLTVHSGTSHTSLDALISTGVPYTSPGGEFTVELNSINDTEATFTLDIPYDDFTAPSAPSVSATTGCNSVHLSWTASTDEMGGSGFDHYQVFYWDELTLVSLGTTSNLYFDDSLNFGETRLYSVWAYDTAGNFSQGGILVNMPAGDTVNPSKPTGLSASAPHQWVDLSWNASSDDCTGVSYYEIKRLDAGIIGTSATTSYSDGTTVELTMYTYQVRAVDGAGNRSDWSAKYKVTTGPELNIE